ncbi:MAG: CRISPR-associated endoribonuclease Cas6 [Chryseobacterium sp.]|nr:MAG: CRISPR-associated endoribonuclease Cas6 [Chryseobacterium sp.]
MTLKITLSSNSSSRLIPINYAYPLSAAVYKILQKGDVEYAEFLHEKGYGKGFKFFTFSQLNVPFKIVDDRLKLLTDEVDFSISFHLPQAAESFVKGLFQSERIEIADKKSKVSFTVKSVESLGNPLMPQSENEIVNLELKPMSPVVAGIQNERGHYDFLAPDDPRFASALIYNWRSKIAACYDDRIADSALLMLEIIPKKYAFKSRLMTIKADTPQETKIRGWMNFGLEVTAERRFVELLMNAGVGVYNSMGCGMVLSAI